MKQVPRQRACSMVITMMSAMYGCATMPESVKFASATGEVEGCEYLGIFKNDWANDGADTALNSAATRAAAAGADTLVVINTASETEGYVGEYGGGVGTSHSVTLQGYRCED